MSSVRVISGPLKTPTDASLHVGLLDSQKSSDRATTVSAERLLKMGYSEEEVSTMLGKGYAKILKYNPYRDEDGRYTSKDKAVTRTKIGNKYGKQVYDRAVIMEPKITDAVGKGAAAAGGTMMGLDFRLKTLDSIQRKVVADSAEKRISNEKAANGLVDSVRYTADFDTENYVSGVKKMVDSLYEQGYTLARPPRNAWQTEPLGTYQGINAVFKGKDGFPFELQFHTTESFHTKEVLNHKLYEEERQVTTTKERAVILRKQQVENQRKVPVPKDVLGLTEYFDKLLLK